MVPHTERNQSTQTRYDNLVATLRDSVATHPDKVAYIFHPTKGEEISLTFAELDKRVRALAVQLDMTAKRGDPVLILCQPGLDYIVSFYACLYAQMKAVPLYPPRNNRNIPRIVAVCNDVGANTILTTSSVKGKIDQLSFDESWYEEKSTIRVDQVENELADYWEESFPEGNTVAFLQYTSGSTGSPKGVMITHTNLCNNIEVIASNLTHGGMEFNVVSWLPPYHDMGLIGGLLLPAYFGNTSVTLPPEAFVQKPFRWLNLLSKYPFSFSAAPNFAYELCTNKVTDEELEKLDLSNWRYAFCGSEPIRHSTMTQFAKRFSKTGFSSKSLIPCYGLAECTLMVSSSSNIGEISALHVDKNALENNKLVQLPTNDTSGITLVGSGRIVGGQKSLICDPDSMAPVENGGIGEIWLSSSSVAAGYWANEKATEETFRAHPTTDAQTNYMRTGDLGFMQNGELYVTGRIKDLMIVNGKNHYPQDIEYTVASSHPALMTDGCAAFTVNSDKGEQVVVVAEVNRTHRKSNFDEVYVAIRNAVSREHNLPVEDIVLISPATLAKTSSGKIQRSHNRQMYLNSELNVLGSSSLSGNRGSILNTSQVDNTETVDRIIAWIRNYAETRINSRQIDERRCIPPHIALDFGEQGLMGMQIPKEYGGLGLNNEESLRIVEQLTAIDLTLAAFVGLNNSLGIRPILCHASDAVKDELLPKLASGRMLASFAITEPVAGSNPRSINARARDLGDGTWSISGEKSWIGSSAWAGIISVFAKSDKGSVTGFAIPQGTPGMRMGPEELTMGVRGMVQNTIYLDDARVSEEMMLGEVGKGMEIAQETMSMTRLGFGAIGLGGMRRCAQLMLRYASRRTISSGLLLDNPVTINRLNTLTMRIYALENYVLDIVRCIDKGISVPEETLMVCKILGTEYLFDAADDLMQMLGGRGYIETNMVPQLFRDARLTRIFEGPTETLNMHVGSGIYNAPNQLIAFIEVRLHAPEVAVQLSQFIEEIKSQEYVGTKDINKIKDQQWVYYLLGEVVQWSLLKAVLLNSSKTVADNSLHQRTVAWCDVNLHKAMENVHIGDKRQAWEATRNDILQEIANYRNIIGDLEQNAASEKMAPDDMLLRTPREVHENEASNDPVSQKQVDSEELVEIRSWIGAWLVKHLQVDKSLINAETNFNNIGLDSIQAAELMLDLDDEYGVDIDMSAAWDYPTIGTLSHMILQQRDTNSTPIMDNAVNS